MPVCMGRARDLKVGLFVLAGLVLSGLVIFLIGDERRLFDASVEFTTNFGDVQGLKPGAPIRMGGIDIGHVAEVAYGPDPKDTKIYVKLEVVESESSRIKTDRAGSRPTAWPRSRTRACSATRCWSSRRGRAPIRCRRGATSRARSRPT
jgi:hypothetical protein